MKLTVQEYLAKQTIRIAEGFIHFVNLTPADKQDWHLEVKDGTHTRSMMEQMGECVAVNRLFARLLNGEIVSPDENVLQEQTFSGIDDAEKQLLESANALATAIATLPDEGLEKVYTHPRGFQIRGENLILMGFRNMTYHVGQVNFIQTLYGDHVFQAPSNWR